MVNLRQKQQEIRDYKLSMLKKSIINSSYPNPLSTIHEYHRITSKLHNPNDKKVKALVKQRVKQYENDTERRYQDAEKDIKKLRFEEREGKDAEAEILAMTSKIYEKLLSGSDYFITEDINKLKRLIGEKLYLLDDEQLDTILQQLDIIIKACNEDVDIDDKSKNHIENLTTDLYYIVEDLYNNYPKLNNSTERKRFVQNVFKEVNKRLFKNKIGDKESVNNSQYDALSHATTGILSENSDLESRMTHYDRDEQFAEFGELEDEPLAPLASSVNNMYEAMRQPPPPLSRENIEKMYEAQFRPPPQHVTLQQYNEYSDDEEEKGSVEEQDYKSADEEGKEEPAPVQLAPPTPVQLEPFNPDWKLQELKNRFGHIALRDPQTNEPLKWRYIKKVQQAIREQVYDEEAKQKKKKK